MIAGGTGITPMLQVLDHILANPQDKTQVCGAGGLAAGGGVRACMQGLCELDAGGLASEPGGASQGERWEQLLAAAVALPGGSKTGAGQPQTVAPPRWLPATADSLPWSRPVMLPLLCR